MKTNLTLLILLMTTSMVMSQSLVQKRNKKTAPDLELYDVKAGDFYFDGSLRLGVGYDDNSTSASDSSRQEEGGYIESGINLSLYSEVTENFSIDTSAYIGYKWWTSGDNQDSWVIRPLGDTLAFDWEVTEKTKISFIDRVRMNSATVQEIADGEGSSELRIFSNNAELQLYHELNEDNDFGFKIGHGFREELTGDFGFLDRQDIYAGIIHSYNLSGRTKLSTFLNGYRYDWHDQLNNDGYEWQLGFTVDHALTNLIILNATLGWQDLHFEDDRAATADEEGHGLFGNFGLNHVVSEKFWHNVSADFRRRISSDTSNNFSEVWTFTYGATWNINEKLYLNPSFSYIRTDKQNSNGEENNLYTPSVTLGYDITDKLNVELTYTFTSRDSDTSDTDYERRQYMMNLTYDF